MPDCLHPLLLALVLLDLGFVQATDVVSLQGLLPLWLLALGSPWLRSLQRFLAYRIAWNVGVLVVFTLLVRHAVTTGLLHMLEDGLLLAVLCQVHLLNNVGERQRPDLVFFNSLLIAFVTSFFAPDLAWSVLFVLHAAALLPALQVNVLARRGSGAARPFVGAMLRDSLPRTAVVGLVTALVFVLCPRDFERRGWLGDAIAFGNRQEAGLGEQIRLGDERATQLGTAVVLRVTPASGRAEDVPEHWRGIAFSTFEGGAWRPQDANRLGSRYATDLQWESQRDGSWRRAMAPASTWLAVQQFDGSSRRLLSPLPACELQLANGAGLLLDPKSYGGFAFLRVEDAPAEPLAYSVRLAADSGRTVVSRAIREQMLQLPDEAVPQAARDLARQLGGQLPATANAAQLAEHCANWLQDHRRYELPGGPGFADNLSAFLLGSGAGHCEYFATALAMLLRLQGVPCRLVGGYLVHEWDAPTRSAVARERDAHAWVEVLLPDGCWRTFDPTPPSELPGRAASETTGWAGAVAEMERLWSLVTGFDGERRAGLLAALTALPREALAWLAAHPGAAAVALAPLLALVYLRRRRRQSLPAIVDLLKATRAAGLELRPGETPRELLARAASAPMPPARLAELQAAARRHESSRYATLRGSP